MGAAYDTKARLYEFLVSSVVYNRIFWGTSPDDYLNFAKLALQMSNGRILDAGCGGLSHTAGLYAASQRPLVLLDRSENMLQIASKRLTKIVGAIPGHITLVQADAFDLPYAEEFDALFSFGMLHLFEDKTAYLDSILSALKPGGRFFISSLTTDRRLSRAYMGLLQRNNEMARGQSSAHVVQLIKSKVRGVNSYVIGSMVFVSGTK